jgi:hypothetical protein
MLLLLLLSCMGGWWMLLLTCWVASEYFGVDELCKLQ